METTTERGLGHLIALVGGLLILGGGLVALAFGAANLVLGHFRGAAGGLSEAVVLFVVGGLVLLFAQFGEHRWSDRPQTTGVMLIVLAIVGWVGLGLGSNLLALVGGLLVLVGGVLYLVEPMHRAVSRMISAA